VRPILQRSRLLCEARTVPLLRASLLRHVESTGAEVASPIAERIWQKIVRGNGCWEWTGTRYPNGYGSCASGKRGRNDYAHRVVWRLTFGRIPDGLRVLHHCDNPPCCRPDHLFLGTDADNVADKVAKGRQLKGEQITGARLRATQIPDIRQRLAEGEPMHLIAADCGVSRGAIQDIALNKTWRHVV
jgi:hypothetical protein